MMDNQFQPQRFDELHASLILSLTPRVGAITALKLIRHFGSSSAVLEQESSILAQFVPQPVAKLIAERNAFSAAQSTLEWVAQSTNRHLVCLGDPRYPLELAQIADPPIILYAEGNIELLREHKFAIVGTRHPTTQGIENANRFAKELGQKLTIVSGMAMGVDRYAHLGALQSPKTTIGIIGTGIGIVYPSSNAELFAQMIEKGLLISELPLKTPALANNFPRRNRIIAGLSKGCLVIESALDGGSLITANCALDMGRDVMAIPGSIYNPVARGCHKLIKSGAKLVENTNDIFEELSLPNLIQIRESYVSTSNAENRLLAAIGFEPVTIDKICANIKADFNDICAGLLELELDGHIINCGNGRYQRIFR